MSDAETMGMSSDEVACLTEIERRRQELARQEQLDRFPHMCLDIEGDWVPCPDHLCEAWLSVQQAHTMRAALERIATQGSPDDAAFALRALQDVGRRA